MSGSRGSDPAPPTDPRESAEAAGLRYVSDDQPGITRRRRGKGWSYHRPDGETIRDDEERRRIEELAIPPAWDEVWICQHHDGHVQATGRDAEGRKQYRYHPRWREVRSAAKFEHLLAFGRALPAIRARVDDDLELEGLPRRKALAAVVHLLDSTCLRVGNDEYERENGTYGLTTARRQHVSVRAGEVRFCFPGKGGEEVTGSAADERVAEVVRRCRKCGGEEVFAYEDDDGRARDVTSTDVNDYLKEITEEAFTAKYFRTWNGTLRAFLHLAGLETPPADEDGADDHCRDALDAAAECLQNTRAVCRDFYVHPGVLEAYRNGGFPDGGEGGSEGGGRALSPEEEALVELLARITDG